MKKVAVIFGGVSMEHEVSLISSTAILKTMETLDYEVIKIGITRKGSWYFYEGSIEDIQNDTWFLHSSCQPLGIDFSGKGFLNLETKNYLLFDILFPVLHGGLGENGAMQGLFEMMDIPFVGCGILASAVSMNKLLLHQYAEKLGIKSTPTLQINAKKLDKQAILEFARISGYPLFVKPNEAGSSKGITRIEKEEELFEAIHTASEFDKNILLQQSVTGVEIGCSIIGNDELIVGECDKVDLESGFFNYVEKYNLITAKIEVPAKISQKATEKIKQQAQELYRALECRGLARIDFFVTEDDDILLNEINTMPGFTAHSRLPMMMSEIGMSYANIIEKLIELGEESYENKLLTTR